MKTTAPKNIIHFSHANGFPAESYRKFFSYLKDNFEIGYISMHGHNPKFPVTENWTDLADELVDYVANNYQQPVYAVGHSLGGILSFLAVIKRPDLFKGLIMLDAPILGKLRSKAVQFSKWIRMVDRLSPAGRTRWRRTEWNNYAEAIAYFQSKELFKNFDPDCLSDYVHAGIIKKEQGIELRFDRDVEYNIYRTLPHNLPQFRQQLKVPAALIYGSDHSVVTAADIREMKKHFQMQTMTSKGGHLFPFEYPALAAAMVTKAINMFNN